MVLSSRGHCSSRCDIFGSLKWHTNLHTYILSQNREHAIVVIWWVILKYFIYFECISSGSYIVVLFWTPLQCLFPIKMLTVRLQKHGFMSKSPQEIKTKWAPMFDFLVLQRFEALISWSTAKQIKISKLKLLFSFSCFLAY